MLNFTLNCCAFHLSAHGGQIKSLWGKRWSLELGVKPAVIFVMACESNPHPPPPSCNHKLSAEYPHHMIWYLLTYTMAIMIIIDIYSFSQLCYFSFLHSSVIFLLLSHFSFVQSRYYSFRVIFLYFVMYSLLCQGFFGSVMLFFFCWIAQSIREVLC